MKPRIFSWFVLGLLTLALSLPALAYPLCDKELREVSTEAIEEIAEETVIESEEEGELEEVVEEIAKIKESKKSKKEIRAEIKQLLKEKFVEKKARDLRDRLEHCLGSEKKPNRDHPDKFEHEPEKRATDRRE